MPRRRWFLYVKPVSLTTLPVPLPRFYPAITVFYYAFDPAPRKFADPSPQHPQTSLPPHIHTSVSLRRAQCRFSYSNTRPSGLHSTTALFSGDRATPTDTSPVNNFHRPPTHQDLCKLLTPQPLILKHGCPTRLPEDSRERGSRSQ